jgi:hypothetical protein
VLERRSLKNRKQSKIGLAPAFGLGLPWDGRRQTPPAVMKLGTASAEQGALHLQFVPGCTSAREFRLYPLNDRSALQGCLARLGSDPTGFSEQAVVVFQML